MPLRVAVMGCVVNGPGEAREADLGVASGNGKGQIFVRGEVIKTVPEKDIVETLIEEAMRIAESMERDGEAAERAPPGHRRLTPDAPLTSCCRRRPPAPARPPAGRSSALRGWPRTAAVGGPIRGATPVQGEQPPQHGHQDDVETVEDADDEQDPADSHDLPLQLARRDVAEKDRQSSGGSKCTVKKMYAVKIR